MKFVFEKVPRNREEFIRLAQHDMTSPSYVAAAFVLALKVYTVDENAGIDIINYLKGPVELSGHDKSFLMDRLRDKKYLPDSYFEGANKGNNYTPSDPLVIEISDDPSNRVEEGYKKLFIKSAGADSKRPITLRQKGKEFFLWEYSSILLSIVRPAAEDPWC